MMSSCCSEVLRKYADCKLASEVIATQESWIQQCQSERHKDRELDLPPTSSSDDSSNDDDDDAI